MKFTKPILLNQIYIWGTKPNLLKKIYQTKFTKLNLIHQAKCQRCEDSKYTEPNIPNQILSIKPTNLNLPNKI